MNGAGFNFAPSFDAILSPVVEWAKDLADVFKLTNRS